MMKKVTSILLAVVLLFCLFACTAFAAPRWTNTASITPGITSNHYYATIEGLSGTTKIACTLVLSQKGLFGSYSEVARTSSTYQEREHTFSGTYAVASGKTYKLEITADVTRNGTTETVTTSCVHSF